MTWPTETTSTRTRPRSRWRIPVRATALAVSLLLSIGIGACANNDGGTDSSGPTGEGGEEQPTPENGESSFYSAAAENGAPSGSYGAPESDASAGARGGGANKREIQEGDIYRVIDHSSQILNLNRYRGLQIVDFTSPQDPDVIGRARIHGEPVEMYLVGDQVYALLNNWRAYYRPQSGKSLLTPKRYNGGMVAVIDISDPKHPKVTKRKQVPGSIQTSRLTRGNGKEALFVVSSGHKRSGGHYSGETYVRSFDVSGKGLLTQKSKLDLGGSVSDIQGAENHLIVARDARNEDYEHQGSKVSLIDISDPSGTMVEGGQVQVKGRVENKHNMDLHDGVLRVVSGATWQGARKNHFQTFDASNIQSLSPIDHASFAEDERLEATLFMEDRAFIVTVENIDPFFAFELHKDGTFTQKNEFEVSGWNDYFVPVSDDSRMIGIGMNNEQGRTMAVSLYDASNLSRKTPMIDRAEVPLEYSYSEANRDDRAFSVLENATKVTASNGTVETGLVLLPFNGWDDQNDEYVSGVRIFSFSDSTVTRRGTMRHGTPVRRSFMAKRKDDLTANLSEAELSLFDTSKPDSPTEKGRVELAPNYTEFWKVGNYGIRRDQRRAYYHWYGSRGNQQKFDTLEVVPLSKHPDTAESLTEISIPAGAQVFKSGRTFVVAETERTGEQTSQAGGQVPVYETELTVWDFSNPTSPKAKGTLTTRELEPHSSGGYRYGRAEPGRGGVAVDASVAPRYPGAYGMRLKGHALGESLVFVSSDREQKLRGTKHVETTRPKQYRSGDCDTSNPSSCTYYTGSINCSYLVKTDGSRTGTHCRGALYRCTYESSGENRNCKSVKPTEIPTETDSRSYKSHDSWTHYEFHTLDLTDASAPQLSETASMPKTERDVSHLVKGDKIYVTHRERYDRPNDPRPYYRYHFKPIDFSTPTQPSIGASVNIPGRLIKVKGNTIVTRDYLWGQHIVESSINKLTVKRDKAYLKATRRFNNRNVESIELDGGDHVLVSHRRGYRVHRGVVGTATAGGNTTQSTDHGTYLSVLDLRSALDERSETRIADWANLELAQRQRALFTVPGGVLVVDTSSPNNPTAQSFFPVRGWQQSLTVRDDTVYLAAGRYGMYQFGLDSRNLLTN